MAGLTSNGFERKRLDQVIDDNINRARSYFGTDAGTSVNDVLGRLVRVNAPPEADLWETAEAVYNSFNPDYATGISLDRIVKYAGLRRHEATASSVTLLVSGDYLAGIPKGSVVKSSATSHKFETTEPVIFDDKTASGFIFEVISADAVTYSLTIGANSFVHDTLAGDTKESIAQAMVNLINVDSKFSAKVLSSSQVEVTFAEVFVPRDISKGAGISFRKVSKIVASKCTEVGPISQPAETLDTIGTPYLGWDTVTNPLAANVGRFKESDYELRLRFANSKELNARGTIEAIYSNLISLVGVTKVQVYENSTNYLDALELPAKCFSAVVEGGNAQEIAATIWKVKPAGIESYGNTAVQITDTQGMKHTINFTRPVVVDIHINLQLSKSESGVVAANVESTIITAIESYFEQNYSVGDDVIYSRLYLPANAGTGYQIDSMTIGTATETLGVANVPIGFDQVARVKAENIIINVAT